eukprot:scaffold108695_cov18-Phaeocystis_antarctica.AAC.1
MCCHAWSSPSLRTSEAGTTASVPHWGQSIVPSASTALLLVMTGRARQAKQRAPSSSCTTACRLWRL